MIGDNRVIETQRNQSKNNPQELAELFPQAVYQSEACKRVCKRMKEAALSDSIVLITGESGTGKDRCAKIIHCNSRRRGGEFISVNCASIPSQLAESEFFGYEANAFTGARSPKRGLLELASGGTLLFNEIGELSLGLQAKLLTFLDKQQFFRVGGTRPIDIDVRIIAATNMDLETEIRNGKFRKDLFYRLNVLRIHLPPLKERRQDIPLLIKELLSELCEKRRLAVPTLSAQIIKDLTKRTWPGNIRDLKNTLERIVLNNGVETTMDRGAYTMSDEWEYKTSFLQYGTYKECVYHFAGAVIREGLKQAGGSQTKAAKLLRISRHQLIRLIKKLNIEQPVRKAHK